MLTLEWTGPALEDLRKIDNWLNQEASPSFASSTLRNIRRRAKFLEDFPRGGRPHRHDLRILRVFNTPYLIRYRILDVKVQILRIHHEREDWFVEP